MSDTKNEYKFADDFLPCVTPYFVNIGSSSMDSEIFGVYEVLLYIRWMADVNLLPALFFWSFSISNLIFSVVLTVFYHGENSSGMNRLRESYRGGGKR